MAGGEEEIVPEEFSNLILDDTPIGQLTVEDQRYLATFVNLEKLCLNNCGLRSLQNLPPNLKLERVSTLCSII